MDLMFISMKAPWKIACPKKILLIFRAIPLIQNLKCHEHKPE